MHGSISKNLKLKFEIFIKFTLLRFFFSNLRFYALTAFTLLRFDRFYALTLLRLFFNFVKNILKQSKNQNSYFAKIIFLGLFSLNYDHQVLLFSEKMDFV